MRRFVPLLLLLALFSSACKVRFDAAVVVNEDETGTFAIEMSLDEEFRSLAAEQGGDMDLTEGMSDVPPGWTAEPFSDGEFEGIRIQTEFTSFSDLESRLTRLSESGGEADAAAPEELVGAFTLSRDGELYRFEAQLNNVDDGFTDVMGGDLQMDGLDPAEFLESLFEVRFVVTMPGTIIDHNADAIDGNTLIWNIGLTSGSRTLTAISEPAEGLGFLADLLMPITAIAAVVLLAAVVLALYRRRAGTKTFPIPEATIAASELSTQHSLGPIDGDPFAI